MLAGACAVTLSFLPAVELRGEVVRLGDVADLSALPGALARRAAGTPLLRIERGAAQVAVPRRALAAEAGARLPLLAGCFDLASSAPVTIRRASRELMPRVEAPDGGAVRKGESVAVRITSGPFSIERSGRAVADAAADERLFVRTASGEVIRAVVTGAAR